METQSIIQSTAHLCRRKIVIAEINILRKFEESPLIQEKIFREMAKLHLLWFTVSLKYAVSLNLLKGKEYQFKYLIDGDSWMNEKEADKLVANQFQTTNSVIIL